LRTPQFLSYYHGKNPCGAQIRFPGRRNTNEYHDGTQEVPPVHCVVIKTADI
jgi:hypothetical protein